MRILFAFLVMIGVSCLAAGAGNAGIDVRPDLETTPFSSVTHTTSCRSGPVGPELPLWMMMWFERHPMTLMVQMPSIRASATP